MNTNPIRRDRSNGYEEAVEGFMSARDPRTGVATVREWSRTLAPGASILDVGCGHGVPISQALIEDGFTIYGLDASAKLISAFRKRFPNSPAECSAVENSGFFRRKFDGIVAWGLMFLLPADVQPVVIHKVARALNPGGKFLFTSPQEGVTWRDALTGCESISLGAARYEKILRAEGLVLAAERADPEDNHYYLVSKP